MDLCSELMNKKPLVKPELNFHHLHGAAEFFQLSIFTLPYQLQRAGELRDGAVQPGEQLS